MAKQFGVKASPLNAVKLDLAIIVIVGILLFFVIGTLVPSIGTQVFILFVYGVSALGWVVFKTRQVIKSLQNSPDSLLNEPDSET